VIICQLGVVLLLYLLAPIRAAYKSKQAGYSLKSSLSRGFHIPSRFDPAPLLYPIFLPLLVSISLASATADFILPNVALGLSSLPLGTVPFSFAQDDLDVFHWLLTLSPLTFLHTSAPARFEILMLIYPLHIHTSRLIEFLTATSLDVAELRLLATALIDLYMFARSPQSEILKALVWLGTILLFITCQRPLTWELALARIPSWRFRQSNSRPRSSKSLLQQLDRKACTRLAQLMKSYKSMPLYLSDDDDDGVELSSETGKAAPKLSININGLIKHTTTNLLDRVPASAVEPNPEGRRSDSIDRGISERDITMRRRHTLPAMEPSPIQNHRTTPSGRPKRSLTTSSQSFLALTPAQAAVRKWAYAAFVYAAVLFIILGPIRTYISLFSLDGYEPFGWALGYLFGNISLFRQWVSATSLDTWIPLPDRSHQALLVHFGLAEQLRQNLLGPANMRLLLSVYCIFVLLVGMAIVLQLSSMAEVDTRRKVFHGMMVAMLLPTVFIDPCFTSLALVLILAIFLLLDLFRAAQLPPVSKPLTAFLAPYVDGRDHRGPIIVSHIFLLIGCAIPLWLSLAAVRRSGQEPWAGWDVGSRDVSMLSGVICVGMGDSAASLIGRRYGRHKWYWGGGKSLEGSLAFAAAVTTGLIAAYIWLRVGGWVLYEHDSVVIVLGKALLAASGASLTEAVLTGANDNVVVPVVLWLLVRGLRL
jgi:dolichol kinase